MYQKLFLAIIGLLCCAGSLNAQQLLASRIVHDAKNFTTDETGNVYIIGEDNSLVKYSSNGDSLCSFRAIQNGELLSVDATNPLKLLLFYPTFSKIVLLDRMLSPKNELDLKKLNLFNISAVGTASDGNIWLYNYAAAALIKIDEQLQITTKSNDLRAETGTTPKPFVLLEKSRKVFATDATNGVYVFDQFGNYLNTLEMFHVKHFQCFGNTLVYSTTDSLTSNNLNTMQLQTLALPKNEDFIACRIENGRLYYLYRNKLDIYELKTQ